MTFILDPSENLGHKANYRPENWREGDRENQNLLGAEAVPGRKNERIIDQFLVAECGVAPEKTKSSIGPVLVGPLL